LRRITASQAWTCVVSSTGLISKVPTVIDPTFQPSDAARAPGPWLPVAEAHQVANAGWSEHGREAGDAPSPVIIAEYMEIPLSITAPAVRPRRPRSRASATSNRAVSPRPLAFARARGRRNVDAGDIGTVTGCEQRVRAGAAASVEKAPGRRPSSASRA
jgi:hypothetical protein